MGGMMSTERRKARRINKNLLVQYRESGDAKCWDIAQVKDISESGIVIQTDKIFAVNVILHLRIKLPSRPFLCLEFDGRIVECEKCQVRIEIKKIDSVGKNMLGEYIAWHINKYPPQNEGTM